MRRLSWTQLWYTLRLQTSFNKSPLCLQQYGSSLGRSASQRARQSRLTAVTSQVKPICCLHLIELWARQLSRYSDQLRAGRSGDRKPVGARFSAPVQTVPGAHPASCTMGTRSFPEVKKGRGVTLAPHPSSVVVKKEQSYTSTPRVGRTACTEPRYLYKGALYFTYYLIELLYCFQVDAGNMTSHGHPFILRAPRDICSLNSKGKLRISGDF